MISPGVVVRDATPVDLFKILVDAVLPDVDTQSLVNGKLLQVATDDLLGIIFGYIVFDVGELKHNGYGHITSLFVNPIFRRNGHATRLVTMAEMDLEKQGAAYVSVLVPKTNTDALLFFEKMGYEKEVVKGNININGNDDSNVIMMKKLKGKQMHSAETEGSVLNEPHEVKVLHLRVCHDDDEKPKEEVVSSKMGSAPTNKADSSDESSDEDEVDASPVVVSPMKSGMNGKRQAEEEVKAVTSKKQKVDDEVAAKQKVLKVVKLSSEESFDESEDANPATKVVPSKNGSAPVKKADPYYSSSEESSDEDEKPAAEVVPSKIGSAPAKKADSSDLESDESSDEDEPNTPATQNFNSRVKTLYVGNLSFSVQKSDIENFFRVCGEVVDVRLASCEDGKLKGFGHVEFATAEAAQYALQMNGQELLQRAVRLDLARERSAYTPNNNRRAGFYKPGLYEGKKTTFADD